MATEIDITHMIRFLILLAICSMFLFRKQAVRVFSSAPILRRYDVFTLETVDGICVIFQGFINKTLTKENGFSSEVCEDIHLIFIQKF